MQTRARVRGVYLFLAAFYVLAYFLFEQLSFPIRKDELHFWPTSQLFSQSLFPSWQTLKTYNDLSTPLPFIVFGTLEHFFHQGIWAGRLLNFILSLLCLCLVGKRFWFCALGVLICPYFIFVGTHLYTDMIAMVFLLFGVEAYFRRRDLLSAFFFGLAVCSRQYAVVTPLALWLGSGWASLKSRWVVPLFPIFCLGFWFLLW